MRVSTDLMHRRLPVAVVMLAVVTAVTLFWTARPAEAGPTFSNTDPIAIDSSAVSTIVVSGQPVGTTDVNVTLHGFSHPTTYDVDILLESPSGVRLMLMSDAIHKRGGVCVTAAGPFDLTFDDSAPTSLGFLPWQSGTFRPYDFDGSPCDDGDKTIPAPTPQVMSLSAFNHEDPNGEWKLYVVDDQGGTSGSIAGGWSLDITSVPPLVSGGDIQIQGPGSSAYHNFGTCLVGVDGGRVKYPIKIVNTTDEPVQYRIKSPVTFSLHSSPFSPTALTQGTLGHLTSEIAPGASQTYSVWFRFPQYGHPGPHRAYSHREKATIALRDTAGTPVDKVVACAVEAASWAAETDAAHSVLMAKSGTQKQVSGNSLATLTGKTLTVGGTAATFTATLRNHNPTRQRMTLSLWDQSHDFSAFCDNISILVKDGSVDITEQVVDAQYLTPLVPRGGSRNFAITVTATAPGSSDQPDGCNTDSWLIRGPTNLDGETTSATRIDVNLAAQP